MAEEPPLPTTTAPTRLAALQPRLRRWRKPASIIAAVLAGSLLFAWLALPHIVRWQAEKFIRDKTGHHLTLESVAINPLTLALRVHKLALRDPEDAPLLTCDALLVDLSVASLAQLAWTFDAIRIDAPHASLILSRQGTPTGPHNWSRLLAALRSSPPDDGPLPRLDIHKLVIAGAALAFADRRSEPAFATAAESFDVELDNVSTLRDDSGRFSLAARTAFGAQLAWHGDLTLNPPASAGHIDLGGVDLSRLAPLLRHQLPPELGMAPPSGIVSFSADYRFKLNGPQLTLDLDKIGGGLAKLQLHKVDAGDGPRLAVDAIELSGGSYRSATQRLEFAKLGIQRLRLGNGPAPADDLLAIAQAGASDIHLDLARHGASLAAVDIKDGHLQVRRDPQGRIDLLTTLAALAPAKSAPAKSAAADREPAPAWTYGISRIRLADFAATLHDATVAPTAQLAATDIAIAIDDVSNDLAKPLPLTARLRLAGGGTLEAAGTVLPASAGFDLKLKADTIALAAAQPYLGRYAALDIASGTLNSEGRAASASDGFGYSGSFAVSELRLNEAGTTTSILAWKALTSRALTLTPTRLEIPELALDGLDTQLIIDKDRQLALKRILKPQPAAPAAAPAAAADKAAFAVDIGRLRLRRGELDFADHSLLMPFGTRVHGLRGTIVGISSRPGAPGQIELQGEVDEFGLARALGRLDFFDPARLLEIKASFRNVEMTGLTPYAATFAGRKIDSGKLSLELDYRIHDRQLTSDNQVIMDRLVLGERVDSPTARDLPLDMAIALLQDEDGRIELGLPVTGSLDDPQFDFGQIIGKVIGNVLGKIVTAPFRALGALFGASGEKPVAIAFEAGARSLTPPEREKLIKLAGALTKRPGLTLALHGAWSEADRVARQDLQLRRTLLERSGQAAEAKGDPGPIALHEPRMRSELESLFAQRLGGAELAGLKAGFRRANPGQGEESTAGKLVSRLADILRPPRELGEDEVARLKGADFGSVLYEKLRASEAVTDAQLLQLAKARGEHALATLVEAGAPAPRVTLEPPAKAAAEGGAAAAAAREVALVLTFGKAGS